MKNLTFFTVMVALVVAVRGVRRVEEGPKSALAGTSMLEQEEEEEEDENKMIPLDCDKFEHIINCSAKMVFLSAGSSGQAWLVKEKNSNREVVLKVLFDVNARPLKLLTAADVPTSSKRIRDLVQEARFECEYAMLFAKAGRGYSGKGPERLMQCYSHNIPESGSSLDPTDTTPLYMILKYCGRQTLMDFQNDKMDGGLTLTVIAQAIKQILEGLAYLESFETAAFIHHDMKVENIAVRETEGGGFTLSLIDFGAMVDFPRVGGDERAACHITTSTPGMAPSEWRNALPGRDVCKCYNFNPSAPDAFDMFAVASILLQFLTFYRISDSMSMMGQLLFGETDESKVWADRKAGLMNFEYVWSIASHEKFLEELISILLEDEETGPVLTPIIEELKGNEDARSFVREVMKCFAVHAEERPLARDLLKHRYMDTIQTP